MITSIHITDGMIRDAYTLAMRRSGSMNHADTLNSKNFFKNRPGWWRHFIGALGEIVFSHYSGFPVDTHTIGRGDDGTDFPGGIQIKCSDYPSAPNILIPEAQWDRKTCQLYVLIWVQLDRHVAQIMGAITRERAKAVRRSVTFGNDRSWRIDHQALEPIQNYVQPVLPATLNIHEKERLKRFIFNESPSEL